MGAFEKIRVFNPKKLFSGVIGTLFVLANLSLCAQDATAKVSRPTAHELQALQLHTAPNFATPATGLRESAPEEIQRLEQLGGRDKLSRQNQNSGFFSLSGIQGGLDHMQCKPLLLLQTACLDANLKSLAHTNLTDRYPIPPPTPSV